MRKKPITGFFLLLTTTLLAVSCLLPHPGIAAEKSLLPVGAVHANQPVAFPEKQDGSQDVPSQSITRYLTDAAQWTGFVWLKKALFITFFSLLLACCSIAYCRWQIRKKTKFLHDLLEEETTLRRSLTASEEKFRLAFTTNPDAITLNAMDGSYIEINEGFCHILGYTQEEVVGKSSLGLNVWQNPADREWMVETLEKKGSFRNLEAKFVCKNGCVLSGLMSATIVEIDNQPHILAITRDITERVVGEKERRLLARAIEQSSDTIIITDSQGLIQYVNPAFEYHSGYDRKEALGNNPRILQSGKHSQAFYRELWETILAGKTWQGYLTNMRKDGSLFQENATISPIKDSDDQIANFVAVKQDVTHEQELKQQLQQAQKLEAIGTLAGGIAHDFNNILGAILGFAEMAKLALPEKSAAEKDLDEVITAGKRAVELVKQILTFSRQDNEEFQSVNLHSVIEETVKLLKASLPSTIHLRQDVDPTCSWVKGDPTQLHQVILNLCTNAKHALAEDKGSISISLRPTSPPSQKERIKTGALLDSSWLELIISDDGCGMDQQTMDRIFDPFFTTKAKGQGTGLGLSVSHGIIQQHGGSITVSSNPGEGSHFRIFLPTIAPEEEPVPDSTPAPLPLGTERIVLVDDENFLVDIVERALTQLGYSVIPFTDSSAALDWMQHNITAFDLLLTDMTMPDVTGADLSRNLIGLRPDLPIIICSGFSELLTREQALALGVKDYLPKPITKEQLAETLHKVLHL